MLKKKIVSVFFISILFFPFIAKVYFICTGNHEIRLNGYFDTYEKPEFHLKSFWNAGFQNDYLQYWENNFSGRNYLLKSYNEIRYSFFRLGSSIIGKHDTVYPEFALDDLYCVNREDDFSLEENRIKIEKYIEHLKDLDLRLGEKGIELLVYTTPNKAYYMSENIPYLTVESLQH